MGGRKFRTGQVYMMKFESCFHGQSGWRPGLVIQNNVGNLYSPNIIAVPLTSSLKKTELPTHVLLPAEEVGLQKDSMALCENQTLVEKEWIGKYVTTLPENYMAEVAKACVLATSVISFLSIEELFDVHQKSITLNTIKI